MRTYFLFVLLTAFVIIGDSHAAPDSGEEKQGNKINDVIEPLENPSHAEKNIDLTPRHEFVKYGSKGLDIRSPDGNYYAHIEWRFQFRFTEAAYDNEPITQSPEIQAQDFSLNRARFKLGGHAYRPWLTYYFEYDFPSTRLLDLRFTAQADDSLRVRVGQWKIPFNRERIDSSGKQQFADRSIVNDVFTLDRQKGVALFGRLWKGSSADSWYNIGVFSATGRGGTGSGDRPLLLGRWQWNFLGRDLPFSQSDVNYREKPTGSIALAGATYRGPFTAFSSAGGGQLSGFSPGTKSRYDVKQILIETAYQHQGFSWQQEYHWKRVEDTFIGNVTHLEGGYAQAGWFPHAAFPQIPKPLEVAFRVARVNPDTSRANDEQYEQTLGFNWFFKGHRNKVTLDFSLLRDKGAEADRQKQRRFRVQYDFSF